MDYADTLPPQRRFAQTTRPDAWWVQPLLVFLGFSAFIVYSTWAAFNPTYHGSCAYWFNGNGADYLSPFYSPEIFGIYAARDFRNGSRLGGRRGCPNFPRPS